MATNHGTARQVLESILKDEVKLEDAQENVRILHSVLDTLIAHMRDVNPFFKKIFNRIFYTGSYSEGLRVKEATEFDLNLVLAFPFKEDDFEIISNSSVPSFARFHVTKTMEEFLRRIEWRDIIRPTFCLLTEGYLMPNKIRDWFQGVVDRARINLPPIEGVSEIAMSSSGPARTLLIKKTDGGQLDVDLVPVVEFKWPNWPLNAKKHFPNQNISDKEKYWFIVPKPAPAELAATRERTEQLWRLHFPEIERHILHNRGCVKPIIKLMKLLRDRQNWTALASYYLKTVVMWSVINDGCDWNTSNLDKLFLRMLMKLDEYVQRRKLPYLFYPNFNLLYKLERNPCLAENIHGSLARVIRNIESNPSYYDNLFRKKSEPQKYNQVEENTSWCVLS